MVPPSGPCKCRYSSSCIIATASCLPSARLVGPRQPLEMLRSEGSTTKTDSPVTSTSTSQSSQCTRMASVDADRVVLECCLEGVESAIQARDGGAHRIELCANLAQGGVTPSIGDIEESLLTVKGSHTRIHVLIRPRPGNFTYSALEKEVMEKDVSAAVKAGAHGVVIGALLEDGSIDRDTTERLVQAATAAAAMVGSATCSITFHRAFDCCCGNDPLDALETLIRLGIDRVLTSGGANSAWDGRATIARLVEASKGHNIAILPGAGVTRDNVKQLLLSTGAREVHVGSACQENVPRTVPREDDASVRLGFVDEGNAGPNVLKRVSSRRVSEMLRALREEPSP